MRPSVDQIVKVTEDHYGIPHGSLREATRKKSTVVPRQVAGYLAREYTELTLRDIGDRLGGISHTTVLHGCRVVSKTLPGDAKLRWDLGSLHIAIGS